VSECGCGEGTNVHGTIISETRKSIGCIYHNGYSVGSGYVRFIITDKSRRRTGEGGGR
jgi:hypothetical protein